MTGGSARATVAFGLAILLPAVASAGAQVPRAAATNPCAVCHLRIALARSALTHVDQWVTCKHAAAGVGCERCHGGDATTSDETAAHRGVKNSADPTSPVHRNVAAIDLRPVSPPGGRRLHPQRAPAVAVEGRSGCAGLHVVPWLHGGRCALRGGPRGHLPAVPRRGSARSRTRGEARARRIGDDAQDADESHAGNRRRQGFGPAGVAHHAMDRDGQVASRGGGRPPRIRSAGCGRPAAGVPDSSRAAQGRTDETVARSTRQHRRARAGSSSAVTARHRLRRTTCKLNHS